MQPLFSLQLVFWDPEVDLFIITEHLCAAFRYLDQVLVQLGISPHQALSTFGISVLPWTLRPRVSDKHGQQSRRAPGSDWDSLKWTAMVLILHNEPWSPQSTWHNVRTINHVGHVSNSQGCALGKQIGCHYPLKVHRKPGDSLSVMVLLKQWVLSNGWKLFV